MDFTDKVIIVTGAASGIGRSCAVMFANRGAFVTLVDVSGNVKDVPSECTHSERLLPIQGDLTDTAFLHSIVQKTLSKFGRLDVLVNCAAISYVMSIMEHTDDKFQRIIDVNLKSAVALSKSCAAELKKTRGCIVNITSVEAFAANRISGCYAMMKAALGHFTRCLALEIAPEVRVNAVAPGAIDTPLQNIHGENRQNVIEQVVSQTPLQRVGTPEDVAQAVLFLADGKLASYITGTTLVVDGGFKIRA